MGTRALVLALLCSHRAMLSRNLGKMYFLEKKNFNQISMEPRVLKDSVRYIVVQFNTRCYNIQLALNLISID
jgi:hypothetical protein